MLNEFTEKLLRGLARTAERVGLILCCDLPTSARVLTEEEGPAAQSAIDDLVDFWLGDEAAAVRENVGLALQPA